MEKDFNSKIYIAGHTGMVGSAIYRKLKECGYKNIISKEIGDLDLRRQKDTESFFSETKPEIVILSAAKVGGIFANNLYRAEFIYDNLLIAANIIHSSYLNNVKKLIFLGSSCIYPKHSEQPIKEEYLLSNYLEFTNEPYAIAKIAGLKLCENYFRQYGCNFYSVMPTNMYGFNDNFDLHSSHVLPALIRKFHEAKITDSPSVTLWGTGTPRREFLYVEDFAEVIIFLLENTDASHIYEKGISHINVGSGTDLTISELADLIKKITKCKSEIVFDSSNPDGTPRKLMDSGFINSIGWKAKTTLTQGIGITYDWFTNNYSPLSKI